MAATINTCIEAYEDMCSAQEFARQQAQQADLAALVNELEHTIAACGLRELLGLGPVEGNLNAMAAVYALGTVQLGPELTVPSRVERIGRARGVRVSLGAFPSSEVTSLLLDRHLSDKYALAEVLGELGLRAREAVANHARKAAEAARRVEYGRKGAEFLLRQAEAYAAFAAQRDAEQAAWAAEWTERLWRPWGGWRVRFAPVGGSPLDPILEEIFVLDEIDGVVRASPGAHVREVSGSGLVTDRVIGAFLDAAPQRFETASTLEALPYHRLRRAGAHFINIPPAVDEEPAEEPESALWFEWLENQAGVEAIASLWGGTLAYTYETVTELGLDELAGRWPVQALGEALP